MPPHIVQRTLKSIRKKLESREKASSIMRNLTSATHHRERNAVKSFQIEVFLFSAAQFSLAQNRLSAAEFARPHPVGAVVMGYQDDAFADRAAQGQQHVGFSVDFCTGVVERLQQALRAPPVKSSASDAAVATPSLPPRVETVTITSKTHIPLLLNGTIDIECGSTSSTRARANLGQRDDVGVDQRAAPPEVRACDRAADPADVRVPARRGLQHA
jgi:hypothetical protein